MRYLLYVFPLILMPTIGLTQNPWDITFEVNTHFNPNVPLISLTWQQIAGNSNIDITKRTGWNGLWENLGVYYSSEIEFIDSNIINGEVYEYALEVNTSPPRYAYIVTGFNVPPVHYRGKLLLLVDETYSAPLAEEINGLILDLNGDGWQVLRYDFDRNTPVTMVKAHIEAEYQRDPTNVKCVYLFGHIPVPYSGNIAPDGHPDHQGAWPADVYYGDLTTNYTDTRVNNIVASREANRNIPGDGKFDPNSVSREVALQIGRVDLINMPAFPDNDTILLKKYLKKAHDFKHYKIKPERIALMDDNFGYFGGETFASSGWINFTSLLGKTNITTGDYFTDPKTKEFLWSYGCGGGSYTSCGGVGNTGNFVSTPLKSVFTMLFGSYFGDWDVQNSFLRAPLASDGWMLTNAWSGRPFWHFYHMGMGQNIGYSARLTQSNRRDYIPQNYPKYIHIALMGDPSLRMHIVPPPSNLTAENDTNLPQVNLSWQAHQFRPLGYYVYRTNLGNDAFELLTPKYIAATNFTDTNPARTTQVYMVRAVILEKSNTGSYYNLSQGIFDTIAVNPLDVEHNFVLRQITISPIPCRGNLTIRFQQPLTNDLYFTLFNLRGSVVEHKVIASTSIQDSHLSLDLNKVPQGMYFIQLKHGSQLENRRILITR